MLVSGTSVADLLEPGTIVTHYRILSRIGSGGMGVVFLAEDLRLKRKVALKFLSRAGDPHARARLVREAQTTSTLDHPNIATMYEVGDWNDQPFLAMAYCPGETLRERLRRAPMSIREAASLTRQIAAGLAAAHDAGIVHRDLKPSNVVITESGHVRILDFGLAKAVSIDQETVTALTLEGTTVGTIGYMSPEQAQGVELDARTDVWSLGTVAHEMLTGQLPFPAGTMAEFLLALMSTEPQPVQALRPDTPPELEAVVRRALQKDRSHRTISARDIERGMTACIARLDSRSPIAVGRAPRFRSRRAFALYTVLALAAVALAWSVQRGRQREWALREAIPQVLQLVEHEQFVQAMDIAERARRYVPEDRELAALWRVITHPATIETTPNGARVSYTTYGGEPAWHVLGDTPIRGAPAPNGVLHWHIEKPGFAPFDDVVEVERGFAGEPERTAMSVRLAASADMPPGMVLVHAPRAPASRLVGGPPVPEEPARDYWMDRYEVSNREYSAFVHSGGYRRRELWREPFRRGDAVIAWDAAVTEFRDRTGRPGPSTWELGRYKPGEEDLPVAGVSWYEAAAYAAFAGKQLPTFHHWNYVAAQGPFAGQIIPTANLAGNRPLPVGRTSTLHRFGAYDLAGNVKEWVLNESTGGMRYILGGAWDEPPYLFTLPDARDPWQRSENFGFRCVKYEPGDTSIAALGQAVAPASRDYSKEAPASDEIFAAYTRLYSYDRSTVVATTEEVDRSRAEWVRETVSIPAATGGQRVFVHLFLPKQAPPPYHAVIFVPGASAMDVRSSRPEAESPLASFVVQSGRALIVPVLRGTYQRSSPDLRSDTRRSTNAFRDLAIDWYRDIARTIDYLSTRHDVAIEKVAYVGISRGACLAPVFLALEPRVKTACLYVAGFYADRLPPEVDAVNFNPRVKIPILMLNGKYDFFFPEKALQEPFFAALGTPLEHKRRLVYPTGHNLPRTEMIKETLDWLDKYLGPVQ